MRVSVAIVLLVLFVVDPLASQRLPRTRSRQSNVEAEAKAVASEPPKKHKAKALTDAASNTTSTTIDASPPPPSPSPSPPPPSSSPKPSATPKDGTNTTSTTTTTTTSEPTTSPATSSIAPPVSSVQVSMSFAPANKVPEGASKTGSKDDDAKTKKSLDIQEPTKEPPKKPSTSTSSPTSTSTSKPTTKSPSIKKPDLEDELRDALKRIHQEVLKQPRNQEAKDKSSIFTSTTKKPPPKDDKDFDTDKGLEAAESTYFRPTVIHHRVEEGDTAPLDAQASIQSTKFVLREQALQQLPSFVRSKDRSRPTSSTVRHILLQKQPLITQQHRQRSDPIDEEANTSTTSTTPYPHIPIVHFDKEQSADGSYKTSYETANNIFAEETGFLKNPGVEDQEALVQQGSYSYTAPDGSLISVTYTADEGGFRASGTHIPTPPPVPPEIQRSLDIIYAQIQRDEEEAAREAELERQGEASEAHEESLSPPTTGSKRESRRYLPEPVNHDQF